MLQYLIPVSSWNPDFGIRCVSFLTSGWCSRSGSKASRRMMNAARVNNYKMFYPSAAFFSTLTSNSTASGLWDWKEGARENVTLWLMDLRGDGVLLSIPSALCIFHTYYEILCWFFFSHLPVQYETFSGTQSSCNCVPTGALEPFPHFPTDFSVSGVPCSAVTKPWQAEEWADVHPVLVRDVIYRKGRLV